MTISFNERLSQLLRGMEIELGATQLTYAVLKSLEAAMSSIKGQDLHHFFLQLADLTDDINSTEPRFAMIIDAFYAVLSLALEEELHNPTGHVPLKKKAFLKKLRQLIHDWKEEEKRIVENAKAIAVAGKEILIHDHSRTVMRVLAAFKKKGNHFRVLVAEQDPEKTGPIIEDLYHLKIPFRVVPAYMITHMADHIDMVFLGGLTLKSTMDFVMDPGTNALVAQFHLIKRPIYLFMATAKFSLWESKKRTEVHAHIHRRKHHTKAFDFERIKFSHDRVSAELFHRIVTEKGVFTSAQIKKSYRQKLKEHEAADRTFKKVLEKARKVVEN